MTVKRIIVVLLVALMSVAGAWAENVPYVDADGTVKVANASEITSQTSSLELRGGWFVVTNADVQTNFITCSGDVHIIIADGAKLTVTSSTEDRAGIIVKGSLTIYGQSAQTGRLTANGGRHGAGIGGDNNRSGSNITINGGVVTANGGDAGAGIGGGNNGSGSNITINGGTVTANGGSQGAGIGGGYEGSGSNITINGGIVTANGGEYGAGIGGGYLLGSGSNITINGGIVTANGGDAGAGIGGGNNGSGSNITINGGTVTAYCEIYGAGIGGGYRGVGSNITIKGGIITATGGRLAAGIGSGYNGSSSSNIYITPELRVEADNNNPPANWIAHISINDDISSSLNGKRYARITNPPFFSLRSADESQGTVFGVEDGKCVLKTLHFCAVPTDGYKFKRWSDGNTDNPREYILTDDTSITAYFEAENVFEDPTGAGMRMKVTKTDNKVYEFKTQDVKNVSFYRADE